MIYELGLCVLFRNKDTGIQRPEWMTKGYIGSAGIQRHVGKRENGQYQAFSERSWDEVKTV